MQTAKGSFYINLKKNQRAVYQKVDISDDQVQSNLNSSNTDGSITMANSNSFLSPNEILPIAQENKYLKSFLISL